MHLVGVAHWTYWEKGNKVYAVQSYKYIGTLGDKDKEV